MIRPATLDDIPALLEMGSAFHAETSWNDFAEFDEASFRVSLENFILDPAWTVLVWDDGGPQGFICGVHVPLYFNNATTVAHELLWWVRPSFRNGVGQKLLAAFHQGADIGIQTVSDMMPRSEAVARLLRAKGWTPVERNFMKRIG